MLNTGPTSAETIVSPQISHNNGQFSVLVMSDETRSVLESIFYVVVNGVISVLGSALNMFNIIVFVKQGFSDSVNISLCSLAVSDVCSLLPLIWMSLSYNPLFQYSEIDFDSSEINYLTGGWVHSCFARITSWITAFITFERCVCIALPLKVKNIITSKRTLITMIAIFLIIFATVVPLYSSVYFAPYFHFKRNTTLVGLLYKSNAESLGNYSFLCNISAQLGSFIIVIICTVILVLKLIAKSKWRHKATSTSHVSNSISTRDKRVVKMIIFISVIFIICYIPSAINLILMVFMSPEYNITGQYGNSYLVSWAIINTFESINSSVSIFVYYNMSSKFRTTLKQLFFTTK